MKNQFSYMFMAFAAIATLLKLYVGTSSYSLLSNAGILALSAVTAYLLMLLVRDLVPRRLLQELDKKAVLITGCDSGFGNMCAKRLDSLGVTVYAGCLLPEGEGANQLKASASSRLHIVPLDITKEEDARSAVDYVKKTIGDKTFWCLLNNAGILSDMLLEHNSIDDMKRVMEVNTLGAVNVTQKFLPMLKDSSGRVVCTVSVFGHFSCPFFVPYCMSKYALAAYVDGLRREMQLTSGVTVHAIDPSTYKTPLTGSENRTESVKKQLAGSTGEIEQQTKVNLPEKYKATFRRMVKVTANSDPNEVVDCMIDAAFSTTPKLYYRPNLRCRLELLVFEYVPTEIFDWGVRNVVRRLAPEVLDSGSSK